MKNNTKKKNEYVELKNKKIVHYTTIVANDLSEAVCMCHKCEVVYKERPYICKCRSNVFLEDIQAVNKK